MKAAEAERRRAPSAFRNKRVREVHALPLGWRHLTGLDIEQVKSLVVSRSIDNAADLRTLEACLLLWSSLMTGRHPGDLLNLSVRIVPARERLTDQPAGLIKRHGRWGWWLRSAGPRDQKRARPNMHVTASHIYLPATTMVAQLVERCASARRAKSGGHEHLSGIALPLFTIGDALLSDLAALLASRHPVGANRARRATTTAEALTRWLPAELIGASGGDVVPASIISGRVPTIARTAVHYGAIPHRSIVERYREAIGATDVLSHQDVPGEVVATHVGDRLTPTDPAVGKLISVLANDLNSEDADAADRHQAMMRYTVALLAFAIAHRGDKGALPASTRVHTETRFCWIRDKVVRGRPSRRLVWICDTARDQLQLYDRHLDAIEGVISPVAVTAIRELRHDHDLPLFDLREGAVQPWTAAIAIKDALACGGLIKNAGRHWLRAKLVGRCSTETLHAYYGHGPVDDGSWDAASTLDPATYRADLARHLDPVLVAAGWVPKGHIAKMPTR